MVPEPILTFFLESEPSNLLIFAASFLVLWFTLSYAIFSPWYTHPLGVITLLMSLSVCGLLLLIDYAMITGGRIDETIRVVVAFGLLIAAAGKVVILHVERRRGRLERRRLRELIHRQPTGPVPVVPDSSPAPAVDADDPARGGES